MLSRREIFNTALGVAFLSLFRHVQASAAAPDKDALPVAEIAPGVFVHQGKYEMQSPENRGDTANAGFVVGGEAVAVIDTLGSAVVGAGLRQAILGVTDKPIRYVINTHMHPDHVFGNVAFKEDGPQFVANRKMKRGLSTRAERYLAVNKTMLGGEAFAGTEIVLPTVEVSDKLSLDLGGRVLLLEVQPTAHTDNDLTIADSGTDTLFLGDLLFSEHVPTIDGSIRGWLKLIEALKTRKAARIVPGHGPHAMQLPQAFEAEERYFAAIAKDVRAIIKEGGTLEDAVKSAGGQERDAWKLFDHYHVRNVTAAFAELEWE
jgi:quinoprotein relay system zinc metallohydrolase 2